MLNYDYITTRHLALQHDKGIKAAKQLGGYAAKVYIIKNFPSPSGEDRNWV